MCGRSSLTKTEKQIEQRFNATFYTDALVNYNPLPSFNVAPSHLHPIVTQQDPRRLQLYKWGLVPPWAKDPKIGFKMINARIETLLEKPSFKKPIVAQRCLVPIDGFYEWKKHGSTKIPYRIVPTNTEVVSLAGLYEEWQSPIGQTLYSFTIITRPAAQKITEIHNRMPAMLLPSQEHLWLDTSLNPKEALEVIQPYPDDYLDYYEVSDRVNKVANNDKDLIKPVQRQQVDQLKLF